MRQRLVDRDAQAVDRVSGRQDSNEELFLGAQLGGGVSRPQDLVVALRRLAVAVLLRQHLDARLVVVSVAVVELFHCFGPPTGSTRAPLCLDE